MAVAGLIVLLTEVPFLLLASVAVNFTPFFFNYTATTEIYTLSLHDALPIYELSPLPSYCALPVLLVMVTTVLLSEVTVLLKASLAVAEVWNGAPAVAGTGPVTS